MTQLEAEIVDLAAHIHAATCELTRKCAALDDSGDWRGIGLSSCAHWLSINAGFDIWSAGELVRVGHALNELPLIAEAFASGRLSFDKVRSLVQVARATDDHIWLDVALQASGSQLGRICRAFRRSTEVDDPDRADAQQRKRRLVTWWREDGMLEVFASLPPEDGAVVLNAIETALAQRSENGAEARAHPADQPGPARRADALVELCARALDEKATVADRDAAPRQLVVHVDAETLLAAGDGGRCHLDAGPGLPAAAARRLACDAEIAPVIEREGEPIALGRQRRVITGRRRRLLQLRDGTCRYPGCSVPSRDTQGHHIRHWIDGGATEMSNLVSLCHFHHHRHHEGEFEIAGDPAGSLRFLTRAGREIGSTRALIAIGGKASLRALLAETDAAQLTHVTPSTPRAAAGGEPCDLDHAVQVLAHNAALAAARSTGPSP